MQNKIVYRIKKTKQNRIKEQLRIQIGKGGKTKLKLKLLKEITNTINVRIHKRKTKFELKQKL